MISNLTSNLPSPSLVYQERLAARKATLAVLEVQHRRMGSAKLGMIVIGVLFAYLCFGAALLPSFLIVLPIVGLIALFVFHEKIIDARKRAIRAVSLYQGAVDRAAGRWSGKGASGSRFRSAEHPYSEDLDIFGIGSQFQLTIIKDRPGNSTATGAG